MRVIIQRVSRASVYIDGMEHSAIGPGLVVLVGIAKTDVPEHAEYLAGKVAGLRIFADEQGRMNRSLLETGGAMLIVSNFTLYADTRKGRRPSFEAAAAGDQARKLYEYFVEYARRLCPSIQTGVFQAHMSLQLENDGPVTIICDA